MGKGGVEGQRSVRIVVHGPRGLPKKNPTRRVDKRGSRAEGAPVQARDPRVWLDSADILDVWTCDDRQPCARSGLWPARARAFDVISRQTATDRNHRGAPDTRGECLREPSLSVFWERSSPTQGRHNSYRRAP